MSFKISIVLYFCLFSEFSLADNSVKDTELFDIIKLSQSLFVVTGKEYGTNIGVIINDSDIILIDPMPGEDKLNDLSRLISKLSNQPIKYIINTHLHEDHNGGNQYFKKFGTTIIDATTLRNEKTSKDQNSYSKLKDEFTKLGIKLVPVKSHTNDDLLIFHQPSNAVFTGDVFENGWHPTFYAGALNGFNNSIDKMFALSNETTHIVPGHGKIANKDIVDAFRQNTIAWVHRIAELNKIGLSIDEISNEESVHKLVQHFNTKQKADFISKIELKRFIDRTIEYVLVKK